MPQKFNIELLKQAIIAILIGAAINIVTVVLNMVLDALANWATVVPGTVTGVIKYLHAWKTTYRA